MGYYWDEFLKDVSKDFICQSSLPKILECFWKFCNNKKDYYIMMIEHCKQRNNYDLQYWTEQYNYLVNNKNQEI